MKTKDYYSLRKIVLGLRDEYLTYYEKIEKLKALCTVDEKKVADFDFRTIQYDYGRRDGSLPELSCMYDKRLNQIQALFKNIGSIILGYPWTRKRGSVVPLDGSYHINSYYDNFPIQISGEKENKEFFEQANSILESEFANYIDMNSWYNKYFAETDGILLPKNLPGEFRDGSVDAYSSWLKITMHINDCNLRFFKLFYNPRKDSLELSTFGEDRKYMIDEDVISEILAIEYPASQLEQYHIDTIESSSKTDKDILIECPETKNKVKLDIQEDEKQFVLRKSSNS